MPKISKLILFLIISQSVAALDIKIPDSLQNKVAISVIDLSNDKSTYAYNETRPMLLASNMKVVTSYVAIQKLGWNFSWHTKLAYSGNIKNTQLDGNLYLIGGGDPFLSSNTINDMLQILTSSGITSISGKVILDNSIFNHPIHSSELHPEPYAQYSVDPNGLLIDSNLTKVSVKINQGKIRLLRSAQLKPKLINKLKYNKNNLRCDNINDYVTISKTATNTLTLSGMIPRKCNNQAIAINLLPNYDYNRQLISGLLKKNNIQFTDIESGISNSKLTFLVDHNSESINTLLPAMNQMSNNTYAKTLFMSLGAYKTVNSNTYQDSKHYYQDSLAENFNFSELSPENGAGLSRHEKLTAAHMTELLTTIYHSANYDKFQLSLPTPSESGTLGSDYAKFNKQLYAKTGTLDDVKAYSGYFLTHNQHVYAISIIANNIKTNGTTSELADFKLLFNNLLIKLDSSH